MTAAEDRLGEIEGRAEWAKVSLEPHGEPYPAALSVADVPLMAAALRAVLALHVRSEATARGVLFCEGCAVGDFTDTYPCPTVTAITAALTPAEVEL